MKTILMLFAIIASLQIFAQDGDFQKYEQETGYVAYKYSGSAKGTQEMYWEGYGNKEFIESNVTISIMGFSTTEASTVLTLGYTQYSWRKGAKEGVKMENVITREYAEQEIDYSEDIHKAVMDSLGFKFEGNETILGKSADVYVGGLGKFWIWKGLVLKSVVNAMGAEMIIEATEIKFNASVSDSKFELPKGVTFKDVEEQRAEGIDGSNNPDMKEELQDLFKQMNK